MAVNTGGSAFPVPMVSDGNVVEEVDEWGMTVRDYFAAHAPKKPQHWFEPLMPQRPEPIWACSHTSMHTEACGRNHWGECLAENHDELQAYGRMREKERLLQWPYAWADEMLKIREQVTKE